MNKDPQDFEREAEELIRMVINYVYISTSDRQIQINLDNPHIKNALQYYLLDAYNAGYDASIIARQ
jgi:hypothetical protein